MNANELEHQYSQAISELLSEGLITEGDLPSLDALLETIREWCDGENFDSFDEFFDWLEAMTFFDQMDYDISAEAHKPAMAIAYMALVQEGFFQP